MKLSTIRPVLLAAVALIAATASAQTLAPNQTLGFGDSQLLRVYLHSKFRLHRPAQRRSQFQRDHCG